MTIVLKKKDILKNFLMFLLCDSNIRKEADFEFYSLEHIDEKDINERVRKLTLIFEEYANGGFEIIHNFYIEDVDFFFDFRWAQRLLEETLYDC